MARNVYAWPPVDAIATMWSIRQPVNRSRSFFTGADISSSAERKRRVASVLVPGIGDLGGTMNGGYCEVLKDLLEGGKNLVRLNSMPVNWYFDADTYFVKTANPEVVTWTDGGVDLDWTDGGVDTVWLTSQNREAVKGTSGDFFTLTISGLPANQLVARPGEYVKGFSVSDLSTGGSGTTAKVLRPAITNSSGVAVIYTMTELTDVFHVELNATDSFVFMIDGELPIGVQPVDANWSYQWVFREVFSDEVGGFREINPWT